MSFFETDVNKPRVFISSVMKGFESYRLAAKSAIMEVEADPIMAEDFPSLSSSSRNACLDGVRSCDALILIIGDRGGWVTPSGKLVIEEELEEAEKFGLQTFVFIHETERDEKAASLVKRISDYTSGYFRKTFDTAASLARVVEETIQSEIQFKGDRNMKSFNYAFNNIQQTGNQACLRFVMTSSRDEQVIDPVKLDSPNLKNQLMGLAHQSDIALFSYEIAKSTTFQLDRIIITQEDDRRGESTDDVRLELLSDGTIIIDTNITNLILSTQPVSMQSLYEIVDEDIQNRLRTALSFCKAFWELIDPYIRHQQFILNAALFNVGHRVIVSDRNPRTSFSISFNETELIVAFPQPHLFHRKSLAQAQEKIDAILTMFRRQLSDRMS